MLARSFLTANELNISDHEYTALVSVLGMLERGEMTHTRVDYSEGMLAQFAPAYPFNMAQFCGSACCIAGWADQIHGTMMSRDCEFAYGSDIVDLFYVEDDGESVYDGTLEDITTAQAAYALRNFLTTGKANWIDVLGD
jgi:hypothetical protein